MDLHKLIVTGVTLLPICALSACFNPETRVDPGGSTGEASTSAASGSDDMVATAAGDPSGDIDGGNVDTNDTTGGIETDGGATGGGTDETGSAQPSDTEDAEPCTGRDACVARGDAAWEGPFAIQTSDAGEPSPGCVGEYPILETELLSDLSASEAACGCECGAMSGAACETSALLRHMSSNCLPLPGAFWNVSEGVCNTGPSVSGAENWWVDEVGITGGGPVRFSVFEGEPGFQTGSRPSKCIAS